MAIQHLGGTGVWETVANWLPGGALPTTGDEVVIPESLGVDVTGALDRGDKDLGTFVVHRGYTKSCGASGNKLIIEANTVVYRGSGGFFWECSLNAGGALKTDFLQIEAAHSRVPVQVGSQSGDAGEISRIAFLRGDIQLNGTTVFGSTHVMDVGYISNKDSDVTLMIATNTDDIINYNQHGGVVTCRAPITRCWMGGGKLTQQEKVIALAIIGSGARLVVEHGGSGVSPVTAVHVLNGGTLDISTKYFEMVFPEVWLWPGSRVVGKYSVGAIPSKDGYATFTESGFHDFRGA